MKRAIVLGLAILTLGSAAAAAAESTPHIDKRQDRQERRINHGIENGSLTRKEVRRLHREARQIRMLEKMALQDRYLHPAEINMLEDALDDLSEQIYAAKHNDRYQVGYGYGRGHDYKRDRRRGHDRLYHEPSWPKKVLKGEKHVYATKRN